jgi:hypothetical protein
MSAKRQGVKNGAEFSVVVENDGEGDDTRGVRNGGLLGFDFDADREKEREFLDSLRFGIFFHLIISVIKAIYSQES